MIDEWDKYEEEQKKKSDLKREAVLIARKKMLVGVRIMKKVREAYGRDDNGHLIFNSTCLAAHLKPTQVVAINAP